MKNFTKIKNTKNSRIFWIISGFFTILDGLTKILSFGFYNSNFNIKYLTNSKKYD